jgi:hypothetical protein
MNNDYKQKISNWLDLKWSKDKRNCEICNTNKWSISDDIVAPIIIENNGLNLGGKTYPQVMLICSNCGNTKYFNVALMNLLKAEK